MQPISDDWVRFLKHQTTQEYMLKVLLGLDSQMRAEVLNKLGMRTSSDVFDKLPERFK